MEIDDAELLFVYGTLMSSFDGPYARILRRYAHLLGEASARGSLVRVAWYPGFVAADSGTTVWGELYRVVEGEKLWAALDDYEGVDHSSLIGEEYCREKIEVAFGGAKISAWTYIYTGTDKGDPIPSGRFI